MADILLMDSYLTIKSCLDKIHRLSDDRVNLFYSYLVLKQVPKKSALLREGQVCDFIAIILTGSARIYNPAKEHTFGFFTEQDWVADHDSFVSQKRSVNVIEALEPSEVAIINIHNMHKLIESDPAFIVMLRMLGKLNLSAQLQMFNTSPEERYTELMKNHPDWILRFPQKHLASYLGMTPETFSRMKRKTLFS